MVFIADGNPGAGADHLSFSLEAEQGLIGLLAPDMTLLDCVLYGPQTNQVSMGRSPNGSTNLVYFSTPTPGSPNPAPSGPDGLQIVINEVLAKNLGITDIGMPNPDGGTPEWIELYNPTPNAVDLGDMSLSDDVALARKYVFLPGTVIAAGGYRVMLCEGDEPASAANTGFGIKANGDTIYLFDTLNHGGSLLDSIGYGVQAKDFSIGRIPDGGVDWRLTVPTAGSRNLETQLGNAAGLKVNEWMAAPASGEDWFEIYNPSRATRGHWGILFDGRFAHARQPAEVTASTALVCRNWTVWVRTLRGGRQRGRRP